MFMAVVCWEHANCTSTKISKLNCFILIPPHRKKHFNFQHKGGTFWLNLKVSFNFSLLFPFSCQESPCVSFEPLMLYLTQGSGPVLSHDPPDLEVLDVFLHLVLNRSGENPATVLNIKSFEPPDRQRFGCVEMCPFLGSVGLPAITYLTTRP